MGLPMLPKTSLDSDPMSNEPIRMLEDSLSSRDVLVVLLEESVCRSRKYIQRLRTGRAWTSLAVNTQPIRPMTIGPEWNRLATDMCKLYMPVYITASLVRDLRA